MARRQQSADIHRAFDSNPDVARLTLERNVSPIPAPRFVDPILHKALLDLCRDGFAIVPSLLSSDTLEQVRSALLPLHGHDAPHGRNQFEGRHTRRQYALLAKTRALDDLVLHPLVLGCCAAFLHPNFLLSALQSIEILPGESPQPLHTDDGFFGLPRPHAPVSIAAIWAIDEFTATNGATVVVPGSHRWPDNHTPPEGQPVRGLAATDSDVYAAVTDLSGKAPKGMPRDPNGRPISAAHPDLRPAVMPAGSAVVFLSTLWHGGGANVSKAGRLAVTAQYCEPWARPQETMQLVVPFDVVSTLPPAIQALCGWSVHPPFIGHIGGLHPLRRLEALTRNGIVSQARL
eukprot:TRINITY_DN33348_c0_g1_i1.p1 TRINITY_DN33348_c0_g1~~TRINITY_DN33348_c0_g1_i1.p1  ORF type:complete len:346 (+),score=28.09 TRINITY_DN33348_c0_g1_i1:213-1250(+)